MSIKNDIYIFYLKNTGIHLSNISVIDEIYDTKDTSPKWSSSQHLYRIDS